MTTQTEAVPGRTTQAPSTTEIWLRRARALAPLWTLLALGLFFSLASDTFLRPINLNNILVQVSTLALLGTGLTFVLLTGEIDLSIAAMVTFVGVVAAHLFANLEIPEPWPTLIALGAATLLGLVNGIATTKFRIPSFMATLAMSLIASGLAIWISQGRIIFEISEVSRFFGSGRVGDTGIRVLTVVAASALLVAFLVLRYTRFGRYVYMTGANKSAARLAGVNTDNITIAALVICGFTAGLAGLVNVGRLGSAQPQVINSFLIDAIGAVVLGGTALTGGRGGIIQTVFGLLIYGTLRNGLDNIPQIDPFAKEFITGVVLLFALVVNVVFSGRSSRDRT
ncbi:MAG: ABC transporter permease [Chloroflexi bacterium]|nr:ABC transporter permease [Chloroflexota bacterium]